MRIAVLVGYAMLALVYAPLLWLVLMSFSAEPITGIPGGFSLKWYDALLEQDELFAAIRRSIVLGAFVAVACALSATIVGRALVTMRRRRGLLLGAALLPLFVPGAMFGFAAFLYFRIAFDVRLGWWSLFTAHVAWAFPFALVTVLITISRFDARLRDAARDLGASPWRAFRDIELPAIGPGIAAAAMFAFLLSFNELPRSIFLRGGETTMPLLVWALASSRTSLIPVIYALNAVIFAGSVALAALALWLQTSKRRAASA